MCFVGHHIEVPHKNNWHMSITSSTIVGIVICARAFLGLGRMANIIFFLFLSFIVAGCGGSGAQGELTISDDAESSADTATLTEGMGTVTATSDSFSVEMTSENLAFTEASSETYRLEMTVKPYSMAAESSNFKIISEPLPDTNELDDESEKDFVE